MNGTEQKKTQVLEKKKENCPQLGKTEVTEGIQFERRVITQAQK